MHISTAMIASASRPKPMRVPSKEISTLSRPFLAAFFGITFVIMATTMAAQSAHVAFDATAKTFRLDGGASSYAFGVNARGELQSIYWGGRLAESDAIPQPQP